MKNFLIIFCLVFSLLTAGCPKGDKTIRELREKSAEMSIYGEKLVAAVGDAYRAGEISQEQLRQINVVTGAFVRGLGVYREAVSRTEQIIKNGEPLPRDALGVLNRLLDAQVVAAFFDVLVKIGGMPLANSVAIQAILSGIRLTILALQSAFSDARQQFMEVRYARNSG